MNSSFLEDLAVPYTVRMSSVEKAGNWFRRAECPEIPGCVTEAYDALDALYRLDRLRLQMIVDMRNRGEAPPRPRPPLQSGLAVTGSVDLDEFRASAAQVDL